MARRYYSNTARPTTLTSDPGVNGVTLNVASTSGYPSVPFVVAIERGTAQEELCLATGKTSNTLTVTRGYDGTTKYAHAGGSAVEHVTAAIDADEANAHINDAGRDDHCFSEDTEILTEEGWLGIDQMEVGVRAWTFDLDTERAELDEVQAVWRYEADDFPVLVSFRTQDLGEVLVTPEHTMIWRRANAKNQKSWMRRNANTMPQQFSIPASAQGTGQRVDLSEDQIALLAWVATEGYLLSSGASLISQKDGPLADRIRGLLDRLGISYSEYKQRGDMRSFRFTSGLVGWGLDEEKCPRSDLLAMDRRQAQVFVAEAVLGDGHVPGGDKVDRVDAWLAGGDQPLMVLAAKSDRFIDFVQTLCVLNGIKTRNYRDADGFNRLSIKSTREHSFATTRSPSAAVEEVANTIGRVWCVTVPKHHTVIARRPGSAPFVAGNTQYLTTARHDALAHSAVLATVMPVGSLLAYAGPSAPSAKWLLCDGSAVSRATYSDLFTAIGTAYGVGDGVSTFNLPDLRGRVPLGLDNMGGIDSGRIASGAGSTRGGTGGSERVALSTNEMPTHTHLQDAHVHEMPTHSHTGVTAYDGFHVHGLNDGSVYLSKTSGLYAEFAMPAAGYMMKSQVTTSGSGLHQHSFTTNAVDPGDTWTTTATNQNSGGGATHENMPPYQTVNYLIRATN